MLVRLSGDRKRLVSSAVTTHSTTSVISGIWPTRLKRLPIVIRRWRRAAAVRRSRRRDRVAPVIVPWCSAQMLSQMRVSSARSLELTSTPPPRSAKSRISAWICALAATSTPCVGSSSSSTPTSRASHLARITFCWLPPDSAAAGSDAIARPDVEQLHQLGDQRGRRRRGRACRRASGGRGSAAGCCRAPKGSSRGRAAARPAPCRCRSGWRRPVRRAARAGR